MVLAVSAPAPLPESLLSLLSAHLIRSTVQFRSLHGGSNQMQKNSLVAPGEIVREALSKPTIFKNEEPLSLEWLPPRLPHRETQLRFLTELFRSVIDKPGTTSPKVLITGEIGTGKTVLTQRFGMDIQRTARTLKQNLQYIHVNCREFRVSLFMILKQVLQKFTPQFPQRGFSSEELLHILLDQLETKNLHIILTLDEADVLIAAEGSTSLYNLTRIQEERPGRPIRLSLIVVLREIEKLRDLDRSTQSTLQRNLIRLDRYSTSQLESILRERVELAGRVSVEPYQVPLQCALGTPVEILQLLYLAQNYY